MSTYPPPITTSNIPSEWNTASFTVTFRTNEPANTYYTLDGSNPIVSPTVILYNGPFTIVNDGITTVTFYSRNTHGVANFNQTKYVKIDKVAPITSLNISFDPDGNNSWYKSLPVITLSATDTISGVNKIFYSWDGGSFVEYTTQLTIPSEGIHTLQYYSNDNASNIDDVHSKEFRYDNISPTTAVDIPSGTIKGPVTIPFITSDSASSIAATHYTIDGTTPTINSPSGTSVTIDGSGIYKIKYFSVDEAGNVEAVKTSTDFNIEVDTEIDLQVFISESSPMNGNNGWYRSSPFINIFTTRPLSVDSLQYKVCPRDKPTTATYTSTVQITGTVDLSEKSLIALEIDQSGEKVVIDVRGIDSTITTIKDIIDAINGTFGGIEIAKETAADGSTGTGYVTLTSPTAATGSSTSEVKFLNPDRNDATEIVFGLNTNYPYTFTETYLYQDYIVPFLIPIEGIIEVTAKAVSGSVTAQKSKVYYLDLNAPVTTVQINPPPNPYGFYKESPDIIFSAIDEASGVNQILYQFNDGAVKQYHFTYPIDSPVQFPADLPSGTVILTYFSTDDAGNVEPLHTVTFNYDKVAPTTLMDYNSINHKTSNAFDILFTPTKLLEWNPYTQEFYVPVTPSEQQRVSHFSRWTNDIESLVFDPAIAPNITIFDPIELYLIPIDNLETVVQSETISVKDANTSTLTVSHNVLKHVIRIYNATTATKLTYRYFSHDQIYTVENFNNSDVIVVDYVYTRIVNTYYTTDGTTPTINSSTGHIVNLTESGVYTLKYFSIDIAGNVESVKTFPATITLVNRAPVLSLTCPVPDGENDWFITNPAITINFFSPNVYVFDEPSLTDGTFTITVRKVNPLKEEVSGVTRVYNVTTGETYNVVSYSGNQIVLSGIIAPQITDLLEVGYLYRSLITSGTIQIGLVVIPFGLPTPFIYTHNIQGINVIKITVYDARGASTEQDITVKLDTIVPVTNDDIVTNDWVNHDVDVTLISGDHIPGSGVAKIHYTVDGSPPTTSSPFFVGSSGIIHLTDSADHPIKYFGHDFAGNNETPVTATNHVRIDKVPPHTALVVNAPDGDNGWYKTNPIISLAPTDILSGVDKTYFKWDDNDYIQYASPFQIDTSEFHGIHNLTYYSVDNVGNVETPHIAEFKFDDVPPVTSDSVSSDWTNNRNVFITVTDESSGNGKIYYTLDGTVPTLASSFTLNQTISAPVSGTYTVKYFGVDAAGNVEATYHTATNQLKLDLESPAIISVIPSDIIFEPTDTYLIVNFVDSLSGVNVDAVRILVDDIEYSTTYNSVHFSSSGSPLNLQIKIGPVANIPNFDVVDTVIIYAADYAGNQIEPVVIKVEPTDTQPPFIKGFWPKKNAQDVSRDTNIMLFIDDDVSGVDIRTVEVTISSNLYKLQSTDAIFITYNGMANDALITVEHNRLFISVGGIVITNISFGVDNYATVRKVSDFINTVPDFSSITNPLYDQESSFSIVSVHRALVHPSLNIAIARFENNKSFNYTPRSNGYLVTVTPTQRYEDNTEVNVIVNARDFANNIMPIENYSFRCKEVDTPPREQRDEWYRNHVDIIKRIRDNLESTYNKRSDATVFHGFFKALGLEIGRAEQIAKDYRDDLYFWNGTTRPELLYQNIGYLLKTEPRAAYSHEQYRIMLQSLMQMFFRGSLKESIAQGIALFLGVDSVIIKESIKEGIGDISEQFMFTLDVDLGTLPQASIDTAQLSNDIYEVLRRVKPAHTFFLLRYLFSEIVRTKDIVDEVVRQSVRDGLTENMRIDCDEFNRAAEIITEVISSQFDGTNNCAYATFKPILNQAETAITDDPADVQLIVHQKVNAESILLDDEYSILNDGDVIQIPVASDPISIISVDGVTGKVCLSRNPLTTEFVEIIYKFNKNIIYREISFSLNTFTLTPTGFDPSRPYLLNQVNPVQRIIKFVNQEQSHAHICEKLVSFDSHKTAFEETYTLPEQIDGYVYLNQLKLVTGNPDNHFSRLLNDRRWVLINNGLDFITPYLYITAVDNETETVPKPTENLLSLTVQLQEEIDRILESYSVEILHSEEVEIIPNENNHSISTTLSESEFKEVEDNQTQLIIGPQTDQVDIIPDESTTSELVVNCEEVSSFLHTEFITNDPNSITNDLNSETFGSPDVYHISLRTPINETIELDIVDSGIGTMVASYFVTNDAEYETNENLIFVRTF